MFKMFFKVCLFVTCLTHVLAWVKQMENPYLFEGDMIVDQKQKEEIMNGANQFGVVRDRGRRWPHGIIWYEMTASIGNHSEPRRGVMEAIAMFQKYTCLIFHDRWEFPNNWRHPYISFQKGSGGCSAEVGYKGYDSNRLGKKHAINLGDGCYYNITVMHLIMHVVGFYHENNRPDRDNFVKINWDEIRTHYGVTKLEYKKNFKKRTIQDVDSLKIPYDYRSIMHFAWNSFGRLLSSVTVETKDPLDKYEIGQRSHLSISDQYQINMMHFCTGLDTFPTPGPKPYKRPPADCRDMRNDCAYWGRYLNRCVNGWKHFMAYWCKRTCGKCNTKAKNLIQD